MTGIGKARLSCVLLSILFLLVLEKVGENLNARRKEGLACGLLLRISKHSSWTQLCHNQLRDYP